MAIKIINKIKYLILLVSLTVFPPKTSFSEQIKWVKGEKGIFFSNYSLNKKSTLFNSNILLIKIDPKFFKFKILDSRTELNKKNSFAKKIAIHSKSLLAINANFFDKKGKTLGLVVKNKKVISKAHNQGNVLSGIFYVKNDIPNIIHRNLLKSINPDIAIQAGPRLIVNSKATKISSKNKPSMRSGLGIDRDGKVLLFITVNKFPGVTFSQIQNMLLEPSLKIVSALNLDGGSSSQIFIDKKISPDKKNISVRGMDRVPVYLAICSKNEK